MGVKREENDDVESALSLEYVVLNPCGYRQSRQEHEDYVGDVFRRAGIDPERELAPPRAFGDVSLIRMHLETIELRRLANLAPEIRCVPILPLREDLLSLTRILEAFGELHLQDVFSKKRVQHFSVDPHSARGVLLINTLTPALLALIKGSVVELTGAVGRGGIVRLGAIAFFTMYCHPPKRNSRDVLAGKLKRFIRGARLPTRSGTVLAAARQEDEFDSERPTGKQSMMPSAPVEDDDSPTIEVHYGNLSTTSLEAVEDDQSRHRRKPRLTDLPEKPPAAPGTPFEPSVHVSKRWKLPEPGDHPTRKMRRVPPPKPRRS